MNRRALIGRNSKPSPLDLWFLPSNSTRRRLHPRAPTRVANPARISPRSRSPRRRGPPRESTGIAISHPGASTGISIARTFSRASLVVHANCIYLSAFICNETPARAGSRSAAGGTACMFYVFDGFWLADRLPYICSQARRESRAPSLPPPFGSSCRRGLGGCGGWKNGRVSVSVLFRSH